MAVTRSAAKTAARGTANKPVRDGVTLPMFVWDGVDKRGKKMKGEQVSKNANMLRAELRRQGIQPTVVAPFDTTGDTSEKGVGPWAEDLFTGDAPVIIENLGQGLTADAVEKVSSASPTQIVAVNQAVEAGLPVQCGALEDVPNEPAYDCITAFDVLEHVLDGAARDLDLARGEAIEHERVVWVGAVADSDGLHGVTPFYALAATARGGSDSRC